MPAANYLFTPRADGPSQGIHHSKENKKKTEWAGIGGKGHYSVEVSTVQQVIGIWAGPLQSRESSQILLVSYGLT